MKKTINTNEILNALLQRAFEILKNVILNDFGDEIKIKRVNIDTLLYESLNALVLPNANSGPVDQTPIESDEWGNPTKEGQKQIQELLDQWCGSVSVETGSFILFYEGEVCLEPLELIIGDRILISLEPNKPPRWGEGISPETDLSKWYWR